MQYFDRKLFRSRFFFRLFFANKQKRKMKIYYFATVPFWCCSFVTSSWRNSEDNSALWRLFKGSARESINISLAMTFYDDIASFITLYLKSHETFPKLPTPQLALYHRAHLLKLLNLASLHSRDLMCSKRFKSQWKRIIVGVYIACNPPPQTFNTEWSNFADYDATI